MPIEDQQQIDRWNRRMADLAAKSPAPDAKLVELGLRAELIHGDLRDPPALGPPCRLAVATRVLHHGTRRDFALATSILRGLLETGGYAVLSLPSAALTGISESGEWVEDGTFVPAEGDERGVPHHFFTPAEIRTAAGGFRAVEIQHVPEEYEAQTPDGVRLIRREWLWVVLGA